MPTLADAHEYIDDTLQPVSSIYNQLWQHQQTMLRFAISREYSLLYAGMSTGKTLFALAYCEQYDGKRLILCPKRSMQVYQEDYDAFYHDPRFNLYVLGDDYGTSTDKTAFVNDLPADEQCIIVVNYATAYRMDLDTVSLSAAVADEAHRLGSYKSKISRNLSIQLADVSHKVAMTGTPFDDGYEKLYGITRFLDCKLPGTDGLSPSHYPQSRLFGHYENDFMRTYCRTWQKGYAKIITGYKNISTLRDNIRPFTLRIPTTDVHDLPDAVYRTYHVDLDDTLMSAYESIDKDGVFDDGDDLIFAPHVLTRLIRLQQLVTSGELVGDDGTEATFDITPRIETLVNIIEDLESEPVVIFTQFKRDVELIQDAVDEPVALLTGDTDTHEQWKQGDYRLLVANIAAGSESVRLQRARHIIFWSVGYSLKNYKQALMRIRRNNQESNTVFYHTIVARGTVDETIQKTLTDKARDVDRLTTDL